MPAIPFPPPAPNLSPAVAYAGAALAVMMGLVLLVWGRLAHRGFLVLLAAGLGLLTGRWLAPVIGVRALLAELVVGVSFGLLAAALARAVWAVLIGALAAALAAAAVVIYYLSPGGWAVPTSQAAIAGLGTYGESVAAAVQQWVLSAWQAQGTVLTAATCAAGLVFLAVGMFLPRAVAVFMSCLVGALLLAAGLAVAAAQVRPEWWTAAWRHLRVWSLVAAGVVLLGIVIQTVGAVRAGKREPKKEPAPKRQEGRPQSDDS